MYTLPNVEIISLLTVFLSALFNKLPLCPTRRSPPRRSPPRRWAEEPPQSRGYPAASRSPPRIQMNSPPQPR